MTTQKQGFTKRLNLTGMTFFRLTVVQYAYTKNNRAYWLCRCDCGNEKTIMAQALRNGSTKSCGCYNLEMRVPLGKKNYKHGSNTKREYRIWMGMKQRCTNPKDPNYFRYGGRGITVCERWINSYEAFLSDMGACPDGYSIDRINNNGNYERSNCRWADFITQQNNTRKSKHYTYKGETHSLTEWCRILGLNHGTIISRINRLGMSFIEAVERPIRHLEKRQSLPFKD